MVVDIGTPLVTTFISTNEPSASGASSSTSESVNASSCAAIVAWAGTGRLINQSEVAGVASPTVSTAAAPLCSIAGVTAGVAPESKLPTNGRLASEAAMPLIRLGLPIETFNMARTTSGSNCVPAPFANSSRATASERGFL
jgi:hypothetical protein